MEQKYFNDAIIGNKSLVASYSKKGELLRFCYPNIDGSQFIDFFKTGVKINDSQNIYLHNDVNNVYEQYYTDGTNILNTNIKNTYFNLKINQTDFVTMKENILVKKYTFINKNNIDLDVKFLLYSSLVSDINNNVSGRVFDNVLMQYNHKYTFSIFSKEKLFSYQINGSKENIHTGIIGGKDYEGLSKDSSICYNLGILKPNEKKTIEIYIYIIDNSTINNISEIQMRINQFRRIDFGKELLKTEKYWINYLNNHNNILLKTPKTEYEEKINNIYIRTILLYPLLSNSVTGGISAAIEIDEKREKCRWL